MRSPEWAGEGCHAHLAGEEEGAAVALFPLEQEVEGHLVGEEAAVEAVDTTAVESGRAYLA
jgi:hypothetical protein